MMGHVEADRISFSFSAPKKRVCYFLAFYFSAEKMRIFLVYFTFRYKYGRKITKHSECFNSADAWRAS